MMRNRTSLNGLVLFTVLAGMLLFTACEPVEDPPLEVLVGEPMVLDIEEATIENANYRKVEWTGAYMQLVFMSLQPGEIIDLEVHDDHDQFIRIEAGNARIQMGKTPDQLTFDRTLSDDWAALIPAGYWHKVINEGDTELKLYTLYAPPEHPEGLVQAAYPGEGGDR